VQFGTYDYQKLDQEFAAVATHLTPDFRANYLKSSRGLKATIVQFKGKSVASVEGVGVTSVSQSKATVVLFLDQTVTNTQSTVPTIDRNRLLIQLERHHGNWQIKAIWPK
jgi:Mce-associated membrane protein